MARANGSSSGDNDIPEINPDKSDDDPVEDSSEESSLYYYDDEDDVDLYKMY